MLQPPAPRQFGQLVGREAALARPATRARPAQPADTGDQIRQRGVGARDHSIEGGIRYQGLDPQLQWRNVGQRELAHRMGHEADLLGYRINQRERALRRYKHQGQPGEAGAGADIGYAATRQIDMRREAVEQVAADHRAALGNGGQVIAAIPDRQLIEQLQRARRQLIGERHAEQPGIGDQLLLFAAQAATGPMRTTVRPTTLPLIYDSNAAGSSARSMLRVTIRSRCRGLRSVDRRAHTAMRISRGAPDELTPSRLTPRRMNGITVVCSSPLAASPILATLPPSCMPRSSHASVSPPQLSMAPPQRADSSGCLAAVISLRDSSCVAPRARRYGSDSGLPVSATTS